MFFSNSSGAKDRPFSNRLNAGGKLTITSSITKDVYMRPCNSLIRHQRKIIRLKSGYLSVLGWLETQFFLIIICDWKDFMFQNDKFLSFGNPYNLFRYFQNKDIDSNKTLWKRQYTNGSIKEQPFLNTGSNKLYSLHRKKKEGISM